MMEVDYIKQYEKLDYSALNREFIEHSAYLQRKYPRGTRAKFRKNTKYAALEILVDKARKSKKRSTKIK